MNSSANWSSSMVEVPGRAFSAVSFRHSAKILPPSRMVAISSGVLIGIWLGWVFM